MSGVCGVPGVLRRWDPLLDKPIGVAGTERVADRFSSKLWGEPRRDVGAWLCEFVDPCDVCVTRGVADTFPTILLEMSSDGPDKVKLGLVTVRRSDLGALSGPRGLPVNWGHSDDISRDSKILLEKWVRGEVWDTWAKSKAAEAVEIWNDVSSVHQARHSKD